DEARGRVRTMARAALRTAPRSNWVPSLHKIEKWWAKPVLEALGRAFSTMTRGEPSPAALDLAKLSFCRALIECAAVSFRHQSMSFRANGKGAASSVSVALEAAFEALAKAAEEPLSS